MDFFIDLNHLIDVHHDHVKYTVDMENPSNEDLLKILKNEHKIESTKYVNHPEFMLLRDELEELGYIKTNHNWHNSDRVLKPFTLNGYKFEVDNAFLCAAATGIDFRLRKKHSFLYNTISDKN
jgi:hypothetical protein